MAVDGAVAAHRSCGRTYRRRRMCVLAGETPAPGALRNLSARGAYFETNARPAIGTVAMLYHPCAGGIEATVIAQDRDGLRLSFPFGPVPFPPGKQPA